MIRLQDPELQPYADHSAWQSSWNGDERVVAHTPPGYWGSLVTISQVKRVLRYELPFDVRLRFLEFLNGQVNDQLTAEALQCVKPACDTAMKMLDEMKPLNMLDRLNLMLKWNVIAAFCNLNPSLVQAMKLFGRYTPLTQEVSQP